MHPCSLIPCSLINGVPGDLLAISDRGLQYGDGLFETIAVRHGVCEFWERHLQRLFEGCTRLRIPLPDSALLTTEAQRLTHAVERAVLKIIITRGSGGRGYRIPDSVQPTRILICTDEPDHPHGNAQTGVRVRICTHTLGNHPALAGLKHLNRLDQVLARMEWADPDIAEGLLQDQTGRVIEGTYTNIFIVQQGRLLTPTLNACGVAGVMRAVVLELATAAGIDCTERAVSLEDLYAAEEVFLTNSLIGIWPVRELNHWRGSRGPLTSSLQTALDHLRQPTSRDTHD
jgi:4-amino-4-deoxychorismate lyase